MPEKSPSRFLNRLPHRVRIVEVSPRDGLQNQSTVLSTESKVDLIQLLAAAGFQDIEVTSFVHPDRVPQLADAEEVFAALATDDGRRTTDDGRRMTDDGGGEKGGTGERGTEREHRVPNTEYPNPSSVFRLPSSVVRFSALTPNRRGLDRALAAGVRDIALLTAASETFTQKNIGMTIAQSLATIRELIPLAHENGNRVRTYISTAFHCPYEGRIPFDRVVYLVEDLLAMGVEEISIGDTIGHAVPTEVAELTESLLPILPLNRFAYHFHDTRGYALANVLMALQYGISIYDSSAGGVGGCPFAPGASGNVATEDLAAMLQGMGIETGIDLNRLLEASRSLEAALGHPLPSRYLQASRATE